MPIKLTGAAATLLAATVLNAAPPGGHKQTRADYAKIAQDRCLIAKPNILEPAQEPGELRPMVLYFVAASNEKPKHVFICLDGDVTPRTKVQASYTAYRPMLVMPVFYGDNSERCRPGSNEEAKPICSANRFITEATTIAPVKVPVTGGQAGYGSMATVYTNYTGPDGAHPRYYHVPVETIQQ